MHEKLHGLDIVRNNEAVTVHQNQDCRYIGQQR